MAKLNKDQIKYAVQRADDKLNEKLKHLQKEVTEVTDPRYDAAKVYEQLYSGERMPYDLFLKKFNNGYYFANGIRELVETNVGFMNEYNKYNEKLAEISKEIDKQRTTIEDKLYLSDDAAEVLTMIESL